MTNSNWNGVALSIFSSRLQAVCEEMGVVLQRTAFSPNIKDRMDFSCAVFDARGELCAQAAHVPVHLGSMAYAMASVVERFAWRPGDMVIFNDPYLGGTHLPDVTLVAPLFDVREQLCGFVANRAHHANIGAESAGSMPLSNHLDQEGVLISPVLLFREGELVTDSWRPLATLVAASETEIAGDFAAQVSACRVGLTRSQALLQQYGRSDFCAGLDALNSYAETLAIESLKSLPDGCYTFDDVMDGDGQGQSDVAIRLALTIDDGRLHCDFSGTAKQVAGNINCPLSVTAAGVLYVVRCLLPEQAPACAGLFRPVTLQAPLGSLLNAQSPAAVVAGNVETSTRVVDVVMGALSQACPEQMPAASHGSMNNVALSAISGKWHYYETIGGGSGAGPFSDGASALQTHMTNTLNTPLESLESHYPVRLNRYAIRRGSGGVGRHHGGDGIIRILQILEPAELTLLTERRNNKPWGLAGGSAGEAGVNRLNGERLPAKFHARVSADDEICIETPGGGGWGALAGEA